MVTVPDRFDSQPDSPNGSVPVSQFDSWIRGRFVELNTALEDVYATRQNRISVDGIGDDLKLELLKHGRDLITPLLAIPEVGRGGFDETIELLGNVGFYMAACRRHEITEPSQERTSPLAEASALALKLGGAIAMAPRFVASHNQTHNRAIDGTYRTFTTRQAERVFVEYNARSAFAYMRAADALSRSIPMGASHPVTHDLLVDAERALTDALALNTELAELLDVDEFYFCVRPYYKSYRVGSREYRGANAGDFAAFNQIDLLLGLCSGTDASYSQVAIEKFPFMVPEDQAKLSAALAMPNLLDEFLGYDDHTHESWFKQNAAAFLRVCDAHGAAAAHHHDELVAKFIEQPSTAIPAEHLVNITASGPPLEVLLTALANLRDQRLAAPRDDVLTRHDDIAKLRSRIA